MLIVGGIRTTSPQFKSANFAVLGPSNPLRCFFYPANSRGVFSGVLKTGAGYWGLNFPRAPFLPDWENIENRNFRPVQVSYHRGGHAKGQLLPEAPFGGSSTLKMDGSGACKPTGSVGRTVALYWSSFEIMMGSISRWTYIYIYQSYGSYGKL